MKKYLILLFSTLITGGINAQVGINTEPLPGKILQIKNIAGTKDLMVVDTLTGKIGIGILNPIEKLHVKGNTGIEGKTDVKNLVIGGKAAAHKDVTNIKTSHTSTAKLEIVSNTPGIPAGKIGSTDFTNGKYIVSDSLGNASWSLLRDEAIIVGRDGNNIKKEMYTSSIAGQSVPDVYTDITANPLTLEKGRWLILAKYSTVATVSGTSPSMIYTRLVSYPGEPKNPATGTFPTSIPGNAKEEMVFGIQPEQRGESIGLPQLFYIVQINEKRTFEIQSKRHGTNNGKFVLKTDRGGSFFCAIRLSEN